MSSLSKPICYFIATLVLAMSIVFVRPVLSYKSPQNLNYLDRIKLPTPESAISWERPFSAESIWNTPISSKVIYEPANIGVGLQTSVDVELLYKVSKKDPLTRLYAPGGWKHRCQGTKSPTGNPDDEIYLHFPENLLVPDANPPETPNNVASILQPDGETIVAVAPLARCKLGGPIYGFYFGEENLYGKGVSGGHGGSGLSGIGGSIRLGELVDEGAINHVLKINVWGDKYLYYDEQDKTPGYRWPATVADIYAKEKYGGDNINFEMGSFLAIPKNITPESLNIKSLPALKLFYALQNYGAYVVDDTAWDVTAFNLQEGVRSEFEQKYGYPFETKDSQSQWFNEYYALVQNLHLVTSASTGRKLK